MRLVTANLSVKQNLKLEILHDIFQIFIPRVF